MIQSQNDYIQSQNEYLQSIDRLEEKMSHLVKKLMIGMRRLYLTHYWPFSILLAMLIGTKNHDILETLTKIQFHHNFLNLTNPKSWTNWQAFTAKKLNLNMSVTPIFNFVIQFQFLNLC